MPTMAGYSSSASYQSILPDGTTRKGSAWFNNVGPAYFAVARTRIYSGRDFTAHDSDPQNPVVALNRSAAQLFFPAGNALGSYVRASTGAVTSWSGNTHSDRFRVIAVVEDQLFSSLRSSPPPIVYEPFMQLKAVPHMFLMIRTANLEVAAQSARTVLHD